jgi:filamentous hemagglutinin
VGGRLDNARGSVFAVDALDVTVAGAVDNASGRLVANAAVSVTASALDNTLGAVQSAAGATRLAVADALLNDRGHVDAGTDLSIQAGRLANTGAMRAERDVTLAVTHGLANDGGIVAGRDITVTAGRLDGGATGVLGAGVAADGTLGMPSSAGDLSVTTTGALTSAGTLIAAGHIAAQGAGIDLTGGKASGADIALTATGGDVTTRRATVTTPGTLSVRANASSDRSLVNDAGTLSAGRLDLRVANLRNTNAARIVQTGGGATTIAVTGTLDNDGGTIASNGADLSLSAGALSNVGGHLQHAGTGTLDVAAGRYDGAGGELVTNGALFARVANGFDQSGGTTTARQITIDAGSLRNAGGAIAQTGSAATRIVTTGALTNDGGTIATNATEVELTAGTTLSNRAGHLRHAGGGTLKVAAGDYDGAKGELVGNGALLARVAGGFDQDGGTTSARQVTIEAGSLSNRAGEIVQTGAGATRVAVTGTLDNAKGTIASNGVDAALAASSLLNTSGAIQHAGSGRLAIDASTVSGANGTIVGDGDLVIQAATFNQDGGSTSARHIDIAAADISNAGGTIVQSGT